MDPAMAVDVAREALYVLIKVSMPLLLVALAVGLMISIIQALTQIQEMTLSFVPKIVAIFISLLIFLPYIGSELMGLVEHLMSMVINLS